MPVYTYACTACESVIEKRQGFHDEPLTTCEQCSGALRRVIHPVGIVFKGSGFYVTDSRNATAAKADKPVDPGEKKDAPTSAEASVGAEPVSAPVAGETKQAKAEPAPKPAAAKEKDTGAAKGPSVSSPSSAPSKPS